MIAATFPTKSVVTQTLRDLKSIERQLVRFARMSIKEHMAAARKNPADALCTIPRPDGRGHIQCGTLAWKKFDDISKRLVANSQELVGRADTGLVRSAIVDAFVKTFLSDGREIDLDSTGELIKNVAIRHAATLTNTEHFLPCVFFPRGGPDEFSIGPVTFVRRVKFFKDRRKLLQQSAARAETQHIEGTNRAVESGFPRERAATPAQSRQFVRGLQARTLKTYRAYPWIACVRIVNCDVEVSRRLALKAVESALHVTRILLGVRHTEKVRLAWSRGDAMRTAGLWVDQDGLFHTQAGWQSIGPVGAENWYEGLVQGEDNILRVFGSALMPLADPRRIFDLHARFIDAISWFGDGATDLDPTASIVKYVSAIERLLFGAFDRDRKKAFAKRVSCVLDAFGYEGKGKIETEALRIYQIRSALLHGACSPRDPATSELAIAAERLARHCILCATQFYPMTMRVHGDARPIKFEEVMKDIEAGKLDELARHAGYTLAS